MTTGYMELVDDGTISKLYYEISEPTDSGNKARPTVVLSHAAFLDSRMWDAQWAALTQQFRVIRYDMIGFGQSDAATGPRCRRADLYQLLQTLGVTHTHLVGCSMGGEIVLDLALEHPALVASVTAINGTPSGFDLQGEMPQYVPEMIGALQQGDVDLASELQLRIWFDGPQRTPSQVDGAVRAFAGAMNRICVASNTWFVADGTPLSPLSPPAAARLGEITVPTLIINGALDHAETLRAGALMAAQIPGARQEIIDNTAHVPSLEAPTRFTPLLLDFLKG